MEEVNSTLCITSLCSTVLKLFGSEAPGDIECENLMINALNGTKNGGRSIDRAVIYNPDAVALWLYMKYPYLFTGAALKSDIALPMLSVMPSVTPVCFASMYSGLMPDIHGIKRYTKPVLTVKTLFDYLPATGRKAAIVSTSGDSISMIFLERNIDYFIYDTVDEVNKKALELIEKNNYDLIVIYNGNYDGTMHKTGPESPEALQALKDNVAFYSLMVDKINESMKDNTVFYGFCPDHGCHEIDGGCGSHGLDMPEDMNIIHFYGIKPAQQ